MLNTINEIERAFFGPASIALGRWGVPAAPVTVQDSGNELVFRAEVPGVEEKDIQITLHDNVLTITAERRVDPPEGYTPHRRERSSTRFSRSLRLDVKVDADRASATLKNGILTLTLPRSAEEAPRQIPVKAA